MGIFKDHLMRMTASKQDNSTDKAKELAGEAEKLGELRKKGFANLDQQEKSWLFRNYPAAWDEMVVNQYRGEENE